LVDSVNIALGIVVRHDRGRRGKVRSAFTDTLNRGRRGTGRETGESEQGQVFHRPDEIPAPRLSVHPIN
jgi:hypothetical protein